MLRNIISPEYPDIIISFEDKGRYEIRFRFANDVLLFLMHPTVVTFEPHHSLLKTSYIKENPMRALCGMIMVYNFLNDTLKYHRMQDMGELIARLFINSENHFMMEGKRHLGIRYNDLTSITVDEELVNRIINLLIIYVLEIDPIVAPFNARTTVTLQEIMESSASLNLVTGKRFGFVLPGQKDLL